MTVLDRLRWNYGVGAWWGALVVRWEMVHLGGIVEQTYLPILRLVAEDPDAVVADWEEVRGRRLPHRLLDSPRTYWRKTYGNYVREMDWAYRELSARLPEPDFEDLVITTVGGRLDNWIGWAKRALARVPLRAPEELLDGMARPDTSQGSPMVWAITAPIVGPVEVRGVEDGAVVLAIPECALHTVVGEGRAQTYACLYGCKAACEAYLGPDGPMSIHFEPNLPDYDCVMRVRMGSGERRAPTQVPVGATTGGRS